MTLQAIKQNYATIRSALITLLQKEVSTVSTYQLQKNGISSSTYKRIKENPESIRYETIIKYIEKIEEIKRGKQ